mmetsp:Transcript_15133/g.22323  ORF Transcript_15133/g.22323 Transcript_15133/m.22323 type:complete len:303 (-) Transcript_15133:153-1061(-)
MSNWKSNDVFLLVTAHPDDEAMFFYPTIHHILQTTTCTTSHKSNVHLMCLSTGNYDKLGTIRSKELMIAASLLGLCSDNVYVMDDARFQDGPKEIWSSEILSGVIEDCIQTRILRRSQPPDNTTDNADVVVRIITFDQYGISGHRNHIDTYAGVRHLVQRTNSSFSRRKRQQQQQQQQASGGNAKTWNVHIQGWELITVGMLRKYCILLDFVIVNVWPMIWTAIMFLLGNNLVKQANNNCQTNDDEKAAANNMLDGELVIIAFDPLLVWKAMAAHYSQFVWYRRLSVVFSRYTYCNVLREIR